MSNPAPTPQSRVDVEAIARDPVVRLALDIAEIHARHGCVTEADLRRRGWTPEAIARHQDAARERVRAGLDAARAAQAAGRAAA